MAHELLADALAGGAGARAELLETAAVLRATRKEELDVILDDLATRAAPAMTTSPWSCCWSSCTGSGWPGRRSPL